VLNLKTTNVMDKKSIFRIELYDLNGSKFTSVTNTFNVALDELERMFCNLQVLKKFDRYSCFIQECRWSKSGILVSKVVKNLFSLSLFTDFELTDDIHQFHNITMKLIERKNEIEAANRGEIYL
jgi:hypothetical protein